MISKFNTAVLLLAVTFISSALSAKEVEPGRFVFSGYADVNYNRSDKEDSRSYSARFIPLFLVNLNERMHFEAETEIGLSPEGETEIELEYADLHYFLTDKVTITAGKFLLPFGQFGPNFHPSWINRSPWTPGIYGSHGGHQAMEALLPILSDVGVGIQKTYVFDQGYRLFVDLYSVNGPGLEAEGHSEEGDEAGHEESEEGHGESEVPELAFEAAGSDNNKDKAFGGRIAFAALPSFELGFSYYQGSYDDEGTLDFIAQGIDVNITGKQYLLRGEYIQTETDGIEEEDGEIEIHSFERDGWYLQGTIKVGEFWTSIKGSEIVMEYAETNKISEANRWLIGANYWLDNRSVIKVAYDDTEVEEGEDDKRFTIQLSYGF